MADDPTTTAAHPAGRCGSIQCGRCYDLTRVPTPSRDNADLPPIRWRCHRCDKESPPFATWREVNAWQKEHECRD